MFWDTYVAAAGIKLAEEHLGPQGRILTDAGSTFRGIGLYTHLAGKFWYGDLLLPEEEKKLQKIAEGMQETLFVIPDLDAVASIPLHEQALCSFNRP